jgi:hypothetical protein
MSAAAALPVQIAELVAPEFGVSPRSVFDISPRRRRTRPEALARSAVVYLTHCAAGVPMRQMEHDFWEERRELRRVIQRIEMARDNLDFDALLGRLEVRVSEEFSHA